MPDQNPSKSNKQAINLSSRTDLKKCLELIEFLLCTTNEICHLFNGYYNNLTPTSSAQLPFVLDAIFTLSLLGFSCILGLIIVCRIRSNDSDQQTKKDSCGEECCDFFFLLLSAAVQGLQFYLRVPEYLACCCKKRERKTQRRFYDYVHIIVDFCRVIFTIWGWVVLKTECNYCEGINIVSFCFSVVNIIGLLIWFFCSMNPEEKTNDTNGGVATTNQMIRTNNNL